MINFKREYFALEEQRLLYQTSFKDKSRCYVYGKKKFITEAGEEQFSAHAFPISKDFWTITAGQLDFTNYVGKIWEDYLSVVIVEHGEYASPSINFGSMGDITPENLQELSNYISKHLSDLEKRIVEDYLFIDEGVAENKGLPNLPENHFWVRRNGVIVGVNLDYLKADYEHLKNELWKNYESFNKKLQAALKKYYDDLELQMNDFFKDLIEKIREEAEKQLGLIAGAGGGLLHKIDQANHGFIFDPIVYENGVWKKATTTSGVDGIGVVISANTFFFLEAGEIEIPQGATDKDGQPLLDDEYYYMNEDGGTGFQKEEPVWFYQPLFHTRTYKGKLLANVHIDTMEDLRGQVVDTESGRTHGIALWGDIVPKFDTIEKLQKAFWLKEGEVVEVLGYYSAGDGAGHKRIIKAEDDGSGVQLANNLWACIVHNGEVNVSWFGAKGDGISDDTIFIQKTFNITKENYKVTFIPLRNYIITSTISIKKDINIDFKNSIITAKGTSFTNGFIFYYNTDLETNMAISIHPVFNVVIKNGHIKTEENFGTVNGIIICQQVEIHHLTFSKINKCIEFTIDYIDNGYVHDIYIRERNKNNDYAINSGQAGDMRVFERLRQGAGDADNLLKIGKEHLVVKVDNIVANTIYTESPTIFNNIMLSFSGQILIHGADCILNNIYCTKNNFDDYRIKVFSETYGAYKRIPSIEINNMTSVNIEREVTNSKSSIYISECKSFKFSNVLTGNRVSPSGGNTHLAYEFIQSVIPEINIYNKHPHVLNGKTINIGEIIDVKEKNSEEQIGLNVVSYSKEQVFNLEPRTYYYRIQFLIDDEKTFGRTAGIEKEAIIDGSKKCPVFTNSSFINKRLRLFRGTLSGVYDNYCDLSIVGGKINDNGITVNGIAWIKKEISPTVVNNNIKEIDYLYKEKENNVVVKHTISNFNEIKGFKINDEQKLLTSPFTVKIFDGEKWVRKVEIQTPVQQLNTIYHGEKMKQEGVYNDYISYMDEKTLYDKHQRKLEQERQLAYEEALKENPELTYEEFMSVQPMTLNLVEEPQPSQALKKFMDKYL